MVTHTIVLAGGSQKQNIRSNQELKCKYATLTQVIVQTRQLPSAIPLQSGMVRPVSQTAIPTTGLYGVSLRFPGTVIPSYATSEAGAEGEMHSNHRIPVFLDQGKQTTIYKPNMLFRDITLGTNFDIEMFYLDCDNIPLSADTLAQIHSITLVFHLEVDQLMPG